MTSDHLVGYRPNVWNWEIGEQIRTEDGRPCKIIGVVESTNTNLGALSAMIKNCEKYTNGAPITKSQDFFGIGKIRVVVGEKVWSSKQAEFNYIERVLSQLK